MPRPSEHDAGITRETKMREIGKELNVLKKSLADWKMDLINEMLVVRIDTDKVLVKEEMLRQKTEEAA
jgi:hypothetical protein